MKSFFSTYSSKKIPPVVIIFLILIIVFIAGIKVGEYSNRIEQLEKNITVPQTVVVDGIDLTPFWKTLNELDAKFIPTTASSSIPNNQNKVWGAIEGLTSSYGDPYTVFFPPKEKKAFEEEVRGNFEGVGMEIAIKDKILTVVTPLKNTPSERAGMRAGDQILKIDKTFTMGMTVEDAIKLIRGPKGTIVTLTVKRNGGTEDVKITRDVINVPIIEAELRDDGVFVISLYMFSATSPELFRNALRDFILSGSDKLVLDLRGNPGGYLEAAVDMASFFLPVGKTVVVEDGGTKTKQQSEKSKGYNIFNENLKMVVLINEGSASASEILAGALREHNIAKLVGEKSFGKGSVQELVQITPETSLKVTVARWLTPNGKSISENGLVPDFVIPVTKKDLDKKIDPQMNKAVSILLDPNFKR